MCELLVVPRETLEEEGLTIEDALTDDSREGRGIRAMFAFLAPDDVDGSERFRPALGYLAERWRAETDAGGSRPQAPAAPVVRSARELDAFLAGGGCG